MKYNKLNVNEWDEIDDITAHKDNSGGKVSSTNTKSNKNKTIKTKAKVDLYKSINNTE